MDVDETDLVLDANDLPEITADSWADGRITLEKLHAHDEDAWTLLLVRFTGIAVTYITQTFSADENVITAEDAEDLASKLALTLYKISRSSKASGILKAIFGRLCATGHWI